MHNLLLGMFQFNSGTIYSNIYLGIVKAQWYSQWILTPSLRASTDTRGRELDMIHKFLASVS